MGLLNSALPKEKSQDQAAAVQSEMGSWHGDFTGISDPYEWVSPWAKEKCRFCKGAGTSKDGTEDCFVCHGTGKLTENRVVMEYVLETGIVEREEVNYILSPPRTRVGEDGSTTPISPSKLFVRLRAISGLREATPGELDDWYSALPKPVCVPIVVMIGENQRGTALKITQVMADRSKQAIPAAGRPPSQTGAGLVRASELRPPANAEAASVAASERAAADIQRRQPTGGARAAEMARQNAANPPPNPRRGGKPVLPTSDELADDDWVPGDGP